ncbi:MAG: hypothetical protein ACYSW0_18665 [Planctomycetota bacterium]|jgi:hypothetical protein
MLTDKHYEHAKSWCFCGHLGDGLRSDDPMKRSLHGGINGHGPCLVEGCDCDQFTWRRWTKDFERYIAKEARNES